MWHVARSQGENFPSFCNHFMCVARQLLHPTACKDIAMIYYVIILFTKNVLHRSRQETRCLHDLAQLPTPRAKERVPSLAECKALGWIWNASGQRSTPCDFSFLCAFNQVPSWLKPLPGNFAELLEGCPVSVKCNSYPSTTASATLLQPQYCFRKANQMDEFY